MYRKLGKGSQLQFDKTKLPPINNIELSWSWHLVCGCLAYKWSTHLPLTIYSYIFKWINKRFKQLLINSQQPAVDSQSAISDTRASEDPKK